MKFVVFMCLLAVTFGRPDRDAQALVDERNIEDDGSYRYNFETDNGISHTEEGSPVAEGAIAQTGEVRFTLPGGGQFVMTYVADENGFRPTTSWNPSKRK